MGTGQVTAPMHPIHKMAQINNSQLSKELIDGAKIQTSAEQIPTQLAEKVVPVMEVNPKMLRICNIVKRQTTTNSTSGTIYTTPTDKDFYLVSCSLNVIKDVTATSLFSTITCTIDGLATQLLMIGGFTLTVQDRGIAESFSKTPIKIDRGTNITCTNSTNVGNVTAIACIKGYTTEQG